MAVGGIIYHNVRMKSLGGRARASSCATECVVNTFGSSDRARAVGVGGIRTRRDNYYRLYRGRRGAGSSVRATICRRISLTQRRAVQQRLAARGSGILRTVTVVYIYI